MRIATLRHFIGGTSPDSCQCTRPGASRNGGAARHFGAAGRGATRKAAGHHTEGDFRVHDWHDYCNALKGDIAMHEDFLSKAYALRAAYVALGWDTTSVDKMIGGMEADLEDAKQAYNDNCILRV